ncbi:hypothetical protein LJC09_04305, partial [Desulfovibrio sp. OttesenSCG-928-F20]|nr:hypothetical protein [Desulfovibrio sp. OttesenSCG-928-F20]
ASMTSGLQPFGYVTLNLEQDCLLGPANTQFKAHEFHYSVLQAPAKNNTAPCPELREGVMRAEKADGRAWQGGLARMATLAWYPHLHFRGCPDAARNFLTACASWAQKRSKKQAPHDKPHQSS